MTELLALSAGAAIFVGLGAALAGRIRRFRGWALGRFVLSESLRAFKWSGLWLLALLGWRELFASPPPAAIAALTVFMLVVWIAVFVAYAIVGRLRLRAYDRALALLGDPEQRRAAAEQILEFLSPVPERVSPPNPYTGNVILAAAVMMEFELHEPAENALSRLRAHWMNRDERVFWHGALMLCRMRLGDARGAELVADTVKEAPGARERGALPWQVRAWCLACRGRHAEALALLAEAPAEQLGAFGWLARAHAAAAAGDEQGARECLGRALALDGAALARAVEPEGPATPLARQMMQQRGPYR